MYTNLPIFKALRTALAALLLVVFNVTIVHAQITNFSVRSYEDGIEINSSAEGGTLLIDNLGQAQKVELSNGNAVVQGSIDKKGKLIWIRTDESNTSKIQRLYHVSKLKNGEIRVKHIPLWLSLVPPLFAIILALFLKEVIVSLFVGIWSGAFIIGGMRFSSLYYWMQSLFDVVQNFMIGALNDSAHLSVLLFSLLIGGMVSIISKNGGMAGVVRALSKYAKTPKSAQFITWLLGVAIFFDDYANTLIVGNTMRSVTDSFKISREKLAYIVDSTAAPVAAVAFITTWIGAELGYIDDGIASLGLTDGPTAYSIFISSLRYSFYPILTLVFILIIIYTRRDYGPMWKAEHRSSTTGQVSSATTEEEDEPNMEDLSPVKGASMKWYNAVIPVLTVILMTIYGLLETGFGSIIQSLNADGSTYQGWGQAWANMESISGIPDMGFFTKLGTVIGNSDSYSALIWASLLGVLMALILTWSQRIIKLKDSMHWLVVGFKTMMPALIILTLAWALAITTKDLHTADYLSANLANSLNPYVLPVVIFLLAALISFSTGSSWSTMAILYPIAIPTTYIICQNNGLSTDLTFELLYNVIATVLAASVLGDHCSPISDTTILSSLASDCNHIDHVRTQLPYALTVGTVACACTFLSTFLGGGILISLILIIISIALLYLIVIKLGKKVD